MSLIGFLILLFIAALCGAIGQALGGFSQGGCLVSIVIGFLGAWMGLWLAGVFGLPDFLPVVVEDRAFPVVWSIVGAALLSLVFGLFARSRRVR